MKASLLIAGVLVASLVPGGARAGVLDSPIPSLNGHKTQNLYSIPGVVNAGGLATFVSCTNTEDVPVDVSVELFVDDGGDPCNDANAVAQTLAAGATKLFTTMNTSDSSFFSSYPLTTVPMFLSIGSARVLATGKVLCTAFIADVYNSPPSSMVSLRMGAKGRIKGD